MGFLHCFSWLIISPPCIRALHRSATYPTSLLNIITHENNRHLYEVIQLFQAPRSPVVWSDAVLKVKYSIVNISPEETEVCSVHTQVVLACSGNQAAAFPRIVSPIIWHRHCNSTSPQRSTQTSCFPCNQQCAETAMTYLSVAPRVMPFFFKFGNFSNERVFFVFVYLNRRTAGDRGCTYLKKKVKWKKTYSCVLNEANKIGGLRWKEWDGVKLFCCTVKAQNKRHLEMRSF